MDYTIMEFNTKTGKYTTIGFASGDDSGEAKTKFIKREGWKQKKNIWLFAKGPICR